MNPSKYLWNPPPVASLPVRGSDQRLPINRIFCVGRNYHAHAVEMGRAVDKSVERAFYFTKSPQTLVQSGATVAYPPETSNYHYEMELVLVVGQPGFRVPVERAHELIYGYACGLDMTRRDLQLVALMVSKALRAARLRGRQGFTGAKTFKKALTRHMGDNPGSGRSRGTAAGFVRDLTR
jgi:2-keto-4-pentenoate hydratase/2-oxohepta-3-ene-1,7-dioic acid hydratase in catechol pathway